jgi:hypothetical protein
MVPPIKTRAAERERARMMWSHHLPSEERRGKAQTRRTNAPVQSSCSGRPHSKRAHEDGLPCPYPSICLIDVLRPHPRDAGPISCPAHRHQRGVFRHFYLFSHIASVSWLIPLSPVTVLISHQLSCTIILSLIAILLPSTIQILHGVFSSFAL